MFVNLNPEEGANRGSGEAQDKLDESFSQSLQGFCRVLKL